MVGGVRRVVSGQTLNIAAAMYARCMRDVYNKSTTSCGHNNPTVAKHSLHKTVMQHLSLTGAIPIRNMFEVYETSIWGSSCCTMMSIFHCRLRKAFTVCWRGTPDARCLCRQLFSLRSNAPQQCGAFSSLFCPMTKKTTRRTCATNMRLSHLCPGADPCLWCVF